MLDEVFGPERFLNELVWAYDYGGRHRDRWPRKHDTILWYAKGDEWRFERDAIDRVPYLAPGLVGPEKAARGKLPTDVWWMTIVPPGSAERTGYPTQKPVRLLERIVAASSRPGELVLDPYAGSGTTGVAAARLGRRWLLVDRNPVAVEIARARLAARRGRPGAVTTLRAITLDFGNTLVPVPDGALRAVVEATAEAIATARAVRPGERPGEPGPRSASGSSARRCRCSARWTSTSGWRGSSPGCEGCRPRRRTGAGTTRPSRSLSDAAERGLGRRGLLARRSSTPATRRRSRARCSSASPRGTDLAILSNWPLASTIDRYVEAAGWTPYLPAIVVSQRVGTIKPHPAIFAAARAALGDPPPIGHPPRRRRLGGGRRRGEARPAGVPRTSATGRATRRSPGASATIASSPDLELDRLDDLEAALDRLA